MCLSLYLCGRVYIFVCPSLYMCERVNVFVCLSMYLCAYVCVCDGIFMLVYVSESSYVCLRAHMRF